MKKSVKILIMERLNSTEPILNAYIDQKFPEAEITFLGDIDNVSQNEIIKAVEACDIIVVQSIFDTLYDGPAGTESFEKMIKLFFAMPLLRKPSHIIHSTGKLCQFLNSMNNDLIARLATMLENGLEVYNVHFAEFEGPTKSKGSYFKSPTVKCFDAVKLWFNTEHNIIWDEHPFFIPEFKTKTLFKSHTIGLERLMESKSIKQLDVVKGKLESLTKVQRDMFNEIMLDYYVILEDNIEDLESGNGWQPSLEEKASLIIEKKNKMALIKTFGEKCWR